MVLILAFFIILIDWSLGSKFFLTIKLKWKPQINKFHNTCKIIIQYILTHPYNYLFVFKISLIPQYKDNIIAAKLCRDNATQFPVNVLKLK